MTEQQKNITLGQMAEMKRNLENNIKNQLTEFMKQTGCMTHLNINGSVDIDKTVGVNDVVETNYHTYVHLDFNFDNN